MMNLKEKFQDFNKAGFFTRVDKIHPLELFIGLDEKDRPAIELRAKFSHLKVKSTSAIEVNQYTKKEYQTIRFSLIDKEISGLFYKFCEDLVEQTANLEDTNRGYQFIVNRFSQWRKMFLTSKKELLSESEIMGLIGELLFLKNDLSKRIGLSEALKSWSGQELTHKDFSYKKQWFEVKSINRGAQTVKISSLEQLESQYNGELVVFSLEKMSPTYKGINLNELILEIKNLFLIDEEKNDFMSKVALQGYEYNNYYDDFVFELSSYSKYLVSNDFPKLTKETVNDAIIKAMYEISLEALNPFKIDEE